jgi:hypothetical protein
MGRPHVENHLFAFEVAELVRGGGCGRFKRFRRFGRASGWLRKCDILNRGHRQRFGSIAPRPDARA